jgi:hypothetical protein
MNKTYTIKFISIKAPVFPLHTIHTDQTLAVTETIIFLGWHLAGHLSWESVLRKKLSSVRFMMRKLSYMLNTNYIMNSLLCALSITNKLWYNFWGAHQQTRIMYF